MIKDFKGKVAVVTGGASGIGHGLAYAFAKRGCKIVLADIDEQALEEVSKELSEIGAEVMTQVTDVSDPEQVAHLADAVYERFGSVNILCNNAGVGGGGPIRFLTLENWNWTLSVNLFGVIYGIKYFLDRMLRSKEPCHIVNTASLAGLLTGDGEPYHSSKFAVVAISETLAVECYNTNVGVSVVCPGYVNTNIIKNVEILRQTRSGLWEPTPEMIEMSGPARENIGKILAAGMDPKRMAEIVIRAIENDILFVITHPEYMPLIRNRFERINNDTIKLHEGFEEKNEIKTKIFKNESPAFSVTYPDNLIELKPNPLLYPIVKPVFVSTTVGPGYDLLIFVSKISPNRRLEGVAKKIAREFRARAKEIEITSNKPITLKDGTHAYECVIEFKTVGVFKVKSIHLSVIKEEKWIRVSIFTNASYYNEDLKEILQTLEFK
ncbi:MAG: SDR family NAD(P)-dependent oxidoreductase [Promethearchaeota archaeon]|jgi:NAD(P)-dependent dehydrogenase (short-subunit alcohol dehydrogenase family)